ncbi:uncharacterized protein JN550_013823 [Neoarthrinium moseri]|uniref:uncharacterized protein n=1 Tax=Neoarthrinium moseri TaxID=1658444 RepID=UPI001FDC26F9|nr:uncharacterized protein JN550_013823 [Neoarthrinium moseri]KAI1856349.1 hypothetical protein JN550_013823 [Neoarthrinium moseri]
MPASGGAVPSYPREESKTSTGTTLPPLSGMEIGNIGRARSVHVPDGFGSAFSSHRQTQSSRSDSHPDTASQRWDILNPTTEDDNHEEFFLWGTAPGLVGHRRRISKLLRSCFTGRRPQPRGQKYQADKIDRPYDPADCEVLPAYRESSDEYDSETWEEIQQEQIEPARACAPDNAPLSEEEVGSILDSCVKAYQADWYHDKLPNLKSLAQLAPSSTQAQRLLHQEHDHPVHIIAQLRRNLFAPRAPWTRVARLVEAAVVLRPSVRDLLKVEWRLGYPQPPSPASACDSLCAAGDEHDQDGEEIESDLEDCDCRRRPAAPGSARAPTPDGPPSPPRPRALPRPDPMVIDLTGDSDEEAPPRP